VSEPMRVSIIYDAGSPDCDGGCGLDLASTEEMQFTLHHLRQRYGDSVEVEFLDFSSCGGGPAESADLAHSMRERGLPLPLLAINGIPRLSGNLSFARIAQAIEVQREVDGG